MWLVAIGLGSGVENFQESGVDGSMLVILSEDDFGELGLSGLQGKKLLTSLEFSKSLAEGGAAGGGDSEQEPLVHQLRDENSALRAQLEEHQKRDATPPPPPAAEPSSPPAPAPEPAEPPAPEPPAPTKAATPPASTSQNRGGGHVIRGAAGGAAGGAIKGAVVGAMLGDAGKGAAVGAAAGATGGALSGLGNRRRARMRGRGY